VSPHGPPRVGPAVAAQASAPESDGQTKRAGAVAPPSGLVRAFGSKQFFKLWLAMVNSALGDWLGFFAITALADRVGGLSSVGAVFAARIAPGLFFASIIGVVVDRFDRKRVMVLCDVGRAVVLLTLPFVNSPAGLVLASLVLELFTLAWQPAKEASVPNLVPESRLVGVNSLSVVAAYGTFPVGAAAFGLLAAVADRLGNTSVVGALHLNQEGLAFYVDALTFLASALIIRSLTLPRARHRDQPDDAGIRQTLTTLASDVRDGWVFLMTDPVVRAVNIGLATGLIGGGMLIPLGKTFINEVLGAGNAGFGLFLFVLGMGMATGVVVVSVTQGRLPRSRVFTLAVLCAGACLFGATSTTSLTPAVVLIFALGICAGTAYVLGFTLLHESVDDEFRGRIFSTLNTLVRLCLLLSMVGGPFLATALDGLSRQVFGADRRVRLLGLEVFVPGIRLTMWLAASIMVLAGALATRTLRAEDRHKIPPFIVITPEDVQP
jgi:dTMP kinase